MDSVAQSVISAPKSHAGMREFEEGLYCVFP